MFYTPYGSDFRWNKLSHTARPAANIGASVVPATGGTKGSWVTVMSGASVTEDVWGILIQFNSNSTSSTDRTTICDIGIDEAGGTSFTVKIPDLICTGAPTLTVGTGVYYYFPLFIKAGSTIGARAAGVSTVAFRCNVQVFGRPVHPETTRVGSFVRAYGIDSANSRGTVITSGTTSEGAWTSLGTTADSVWWWQVGFGIADATLGGRVYAADVSVGDSSNKRIVIENQFFTAASTETINAPCLMAGCEVRVASGVDVYGRLQCSGTVDTNPYMAVYALGG